MSKEIEIQKIKDLLDMGFIHEEEYQRRIKEILGDDPMPGTNVDSNNATDLAEVRRQEEEQLRREEEQLRREEEQFRREEEMLRREAEAMRQAIELERREREKAEAERRAMEEAEWRAKEEAERMAREEAERMAREAERRAIEDAMYAQNHYANIDVPPPPPPPVVTVPKPWVPPTIEHRPTYEPEPYHEQYFNPPPAYEAQETPAFDPNATYSTPTYYAPAGIPLYPIYSPSYFSTVHPFAYVASDPNNPHKETDGSTKLAEIRRIIEESKKNRPSEGYGNQYNYNQSSWEQTERATKEANEKMRKIINETPKKPFPEKVDDGIDPKTLPQPTVHMIPPATWDDSTETYEAPKYILPSSPNGVIVCYRTTGGVFQSKEMQSATLSSILHEFGMTQGSLTNVQSGEKFDSDHHLTQPLASGCYRLEQKITRLFYRSHGVMPLIDSASTSSNSNSFSCQYERVPAALQDKLTTTYSSNIIFSRGNVRTTSSMSSNGYNPLHKPHIQGDSSSSSYYDNLFKSDTKPTPGWFKEIREKNAKLDFVVSLRNVFKKTSYDMPLRLHVLLKECTATSKCIVCKDPTETFLCGTHTDENCLALWNAANRDFDKLFDAPEPYVEPNPDEPSPTPIYYKNFGESIAYDDSSKSRYIDFSDPNLESKVPLTGMLAERFQRIKETSRMPFNSTLDDDYLVHKFGSEQDRLYD